MHLARILRGFIGVGRVDSSKNPSAFKSKFLLIIRKAPGSGFWIKDVTRQKIKSSLKFWSNPPQKNPSRIISLHVPGLSPSINPSVPSDKSTQYFPLNPLITPKESFSLTHQSKSPKTHNPSTLYQLFKFFFPWNPFCAILKNEEKVYNQDTGNIWHKQTRWCQIFFYTTKTACRNWYFTAPIRLFCLNPFLIISRCHLASVLPFLRCHHRHFTKAFIRFYPEPFLLNRLCQQPFSCFCV